jgi:hypothetical protein
MPAGELYEVHQPAELGNFLIDHYKIRKPKELDQLRGLPPMSSENGKNDAESKSDGGGCSSRNDAGRCASS